MPMFGYHAHARSVTFEIQIAGGLFKLIARDYCTKIFAVEASRRRGLLTDRFTFTLSRFSLLFTRVIADN